jgi:hypothetical protein
LLLSICLDLLLLYSMVICMTSLVSNFLVMFYLLFSLIKSWGKLLIYSTPLIGSSACFITALPFKISLTYCYCCWSGNADRLLCCFSCRCCMIYPSRRTYVIGGKKNKCHAVMHICWVFHAWILNNPASSWRYLSVTYAPDGGIQYPGGSDLEGENRGGHRSGLTFANPEPRIYMVLAIAERFFVA